MTMTHSNISHQSLQGVFEAVRPEDRKGIDLGIYADAPLQGLALDSRCVKSGDAFFALPGEHVSGSDYIREAVTKGAAAVFVASDLQYEKSARTPGGFCLFDGVPLIAIENLGVNLSAMAKKYYQDSSSDTQVLGITGTNGKTTCAYWMASILSALDGKVGFVGTLGVGIFEKGRRISLVSTGYTTPDAIATQCYLAEAANKDCNRIVMEVSSHALEQQRVAAVDFSTAVFTNLSRDHLDFHQSMEKYAAAKRKLFQDFSISSAIINIDDDYGKELAALNFAGRVITYSTHNCNASVYAKNAFYTLEGVEADVVALGQQARLTLPVMGAFNLSNALAAVAVALAQGFEFERVVQEVSRLPGVPGRMQLVQLDHALQSSDILVIVDYAHTPDALSLALKTLRAHTESALICVFGCGGDRDKGKRAQMGRKAEEVADHIYLTSDNPRNEQPQAIVEDIQQAIKKSDVVVELDRALAIQQAIESAEPGSVVLIAGKGHEEYQIVQGGQHRFSDYEVAHQALTRRCVA